MSAYLSRNARTSACVARNCAAASRSAGDWRGTIFRDHSPHVVEFLYALSRSDGADRTRSGSGLGTAARNGEPFGELGLVVPQDALWHDQTGGPDDPQAGNTPGGKKDTK